MADKVELLHLPRSGDSSIVLSETRSILAARGRKHAASIMACKPVPKLFAGAMSGGKSDLDKQGDADEQFRRGERHYYGKSAQEDDAQAAVWFRKSGDQGNASAPVSLGFRNKDGEGVSQDYQQAAVWYRRAADQGHARAEFNLGLLYDFGLGVPQDSAQAAFWFRKAADQGCC